MEYNVGDKVKIKNDLNFKGYEVTPTMKYRCKQLM